MERDSFIFYRSFYEAIAELPKAEKADVVQAVCEYALDGVEPELSGISKAMFTLIKPQIDANNKRYLNGKKGGAPKGNSNAKNNRKTTKIQPTVVLNNSAEQPKNNLETTKIQPNVNDNVNVNVNDNVNDNVNHNEPAKVNLIDRLSDYQLQELRNTYIIFDLLVDKLQDAIDGSTINVKNPYAYIKGVAEKERWRKY